MPHLSRVEVEAQHSNGMRQEGSDFGSGSMIPRRRHGWSRTRKINSANSEDAAARPSAKGRYRQGGRQESAMKRAPGGAAARARPAPVADGSVACDASTMLVALLRKPIGRLYKLTEPSRKPT